MSEPYTETLNYCTRCGDELTEAECEVYAREDVTSPPVCRGCIEELLEQFNDALLPIIQQYGEIARNVTEGIAEMIGTRK